MLTRLPYIGMLILSFPAIFWNYISIAANLRDGDKLDMWFAMGGLCGVALALIALYGILTGKPFTNLPKALQLLAVATAAVASLIAVGFLLILFVALNWK